MRAVFNRELLEIFRSCCNISLMDHLFTPWRYAYITTGDEASGCLFCVKQAESDDAKALVVHRGEHCFVILNAYPYTSGHAMVVPYQHVDSFAKLPLPAATEMLRLCQQLENSLRELYHPEGINMGMNIGKAAGAGVAGHIHMHMLPRWSADANFMSVIGETRVLPEALEITWQRLSQLFRK